MQPNGRSELLQLTEWDDGAAMVAADWLCERGHHVRWQAIRCRSAPVPDLEATGDGNGDGDGNGNGYGDGDGYGYGYGNGDGDGDGQ